MVSLGKQYKVSSKGIVIINELVNGQWHKARIEAVLFVSNIKKNLFSVSTCAKKEYCVIFKEQCVVLKRENKV